MATPASATTPMCTANAGNTATTVHNGTVLTLNSSANQTLAATNKIGLVLNAAMTVGNFHLSLTLQRV